MDEDSLHVFWVRRRPLHLDAREFQHLRDQVFHPKVVEFLVALFLTELFRRESFGTATNIFWIIIWCLVVSPSQILDNRKVVHLFIGLTAYWTDFLLSARVCTIFEKLNAQVMLRICLFNLADWLGFWHQTTKEFLVSLTLSFSTLASC